MCQTASRLNEDAAYCSPSAVNLVKTLSRSSTASGARNETICGPGQRGAEGWAQRSLQAGALPRRGEAEALDLTKPPHAMVTDSLVSLELRYWLAREPGVQMAVLEMTSKASVEHLAQSTLNTSLTEADVL